MGGKSNSSNDRMVRMQEEQAAEARAKDELRTKRIDQGLAGIKSAFEGHPIMAKKSYDWKGFDPKTAKAGAVPGMAGYTFVNQPAVAAQAATYSPSQTHQVAGRDGTGSTWTDPGQLLTPAVAADPGGWMIKGPDGKLHKVGETVSANVSTGKNTGGLTDFVDQYKQGIIDYLKPQVTKKYGQAKDALTYALANAGTGTSSMANEQVADLAGQNIERLADVNKAANTGAADLRGKIDDTRAKLTSQLYATENPGVVTDQALSAVKNIGLEKPNITPLGEIFKIALIGGANALGGYRQQQTVNQIGQAAQDATKLYS